MATVIERLQVVGVCDQPDSMGLQVADPTLLPGFQRFTASAGTAAAIVSAALTGATNDVYVGHIVKCVGPATSANFGLWNRVESFSAAGDQVNLEEDWPTAVVSGDQFEGYHNPMAMFVEDTGGGAATAIDDASRDEATNYFDDDKGDYAVAVAGSIAENLIRQVQSFTTAGGALAVTALTGAPAVGDLFDILAFPNFLGPILFDRKQGDTARTIMRGGVQAFDREVHALGSRSWTAQMGVEWKGAGTAGARNADVYRILAAFFEEVTGLQSTIAAGSDTDTFQVTDGDAATNWPVGAPWLHAASGRAGIVTSTAADGGNPDDINVAPNLVRAAFLNEVLYGGRAYYPKTTLARGLTFVEWDGETKNYHFGGYLSSLKLVDWMRDKVPRLDMGFTGGPWFGRRKTTSPTPTRSPVVPTAVTNDYITLGASTRLLLMSLEVDFRPTVRVEPFVNVPDGYYGGVYVDWNPIIRCVAKYDGRSPKDTFAEIDRYQNGAPFSLCGQHDERPGHTPLVYAHRCQWFSPKIKSSEGLRTIELEAEPKFTDVTDLRPIYIANV